MNQGELNTLETLAEAFARLPVGYLGQGPTGLFLFADRAPFTTHSFTSASEAREFFADRRFIVQPGYESYITLPDALK